MLHTVHMIVVKVGKNQQIDFLRQPACDVLIIDSFFYTMLTSSSAVISPTECGSSQLLIPNYPGEKRSVAYRMEMLTHVQVAIHKVPYLNPDPKIYIISED
ncbi:hypothetical protein BFW87_25595 [Pseudomonas fluorescens]|uniref:Uncharacterized protein n=1 Tax=Pseudomonas fluorescens TaxID=294 RepID=A0A1T2Y265_PSEFL|nr:hypothetical protein BFW87_25595 [Pseudomonas fluorescens]